MNKLYILGNESFLQAAMDFKLFLTYYSAYFQEFSYTIFYIDIIPKSF